MNLPKEKNTSFAPAENQKNSLMKLVAEEARYKNIYQTATNTKESLKRRLKRIDEAALIDALEAGKLAGVGLDVFEIEPLKNSPLNSMENVILTPHVAGLSEPAIISMGKRCVSNILTIMDGRDPGGGLLLNPAVLEMGADER